MADRSLQTKQIAARFGVCDRTVRRWYDKGKLPGAFKAGKGSTIRISETDLERLRKSRSR